MLLEATRRRRMCARPRYRITTWSRLIAYTPVEHPALRIDVLNQLHGNIQDVFNDYGVQIMSPHYVMDPPAPQVIPKNLWYAASAVPA